MKFIWNGYDWVSNVKLTTDGNPAPAKVPVFWNGKPIQKGGMRNPDWLPGFITVALGDLGDKPQEFMDHFKGATAHIPQGISESTAYIEIPKEVVERFVGWTTWIEQPKKFQEDWA